MAISRTPLKRKFLFGSISIPDPNPNMTPEEVRTFLAPQYPEITTAALTGPDATGGTLTYHFSKAIGTKG